jgi:outer membrane protein OmpA-like peptidoglycan-associated protein
MRRLTLLLILLVSCRHKPAPAPPAPPPPKNNLVVLLDEDGHVGRIVVANTLGVQTLDQARQAVRIERADVAPGTPFVMDEAEVRTRFGGALDLLPPAETRFLLYFNEATEQLTAESEAQIPAVLQTIRERGSTLISVTGHTDTTGDRRLNQQLGQRRADYVARRLREAGVAADALFADSHGKDDLLVKTADGVAEPKNRRVEILVR